MSRFLRNLTWQIWCCVVWMALRLISLIEWQFSGLLRGAPRYDESGMKVKDTCPEVAHWANIRP